MYVWFTGEVVFRVLVCMSGSLVRLCSGCMYVCLVHW